MASTKISAMPAAATLGATDVLPIVSGGVNQKLSGLNLVSSISNVTSHAAAVNPTVSDDGTQGYLPGSSWINTVTGAIFICRTNGTNTAVWQRDGIQPFSGYVSGNYYATVPVGTPTTAGAPGSTSIRIQMFFVYERVMISQLGLKVTTISAGQTGMVGIYANDPATCSPVGAPLASVTGVAGGTLGVIMVALGANVTLEPGIYWVGTQCSDGVMQVASFNGSHAGYAAIAGSSSLTSLNASTGGCFNLSNTFGTFPTVTATTAGVSSGAQGGFGFFRVA